MRALISTLTVCLLACAASQVQAEDNPKSKSTSGEVSGLELFEQRIMPIFRSPKPSSCVQCHLASVDLKDYILPSHEKTFASLRKQGLINLDSPKDSKILKLIAMGEKDLDRGAKLIHKRTRLAEYEAFSAWIEACCNDPELRASSAIDAAIAKPKTPLAVIRHNRKSRLANSFTRNIWSQRMRCFPCHTPHEIDDNNPNHAKPRERHALLLKQYGQRINIFRETPEATMAALLASSRRKSKKHLPLINVEKPRESLLVLKPTSKVPAKLGPGKFAPPSSLNPVSHMGGLKMHVDDQSYKSFLTWINDYAHVVRNEYSTVDDLPSDNWFPSKHVVRIKNAPADWPNLARVQLFVHEMSKGGKGWNEKPIAFTQGTLTPRKMVNGALFLIADGNPQLSKDWTLDGGKLPPGKYLIRAYLDSKGQLKHDPTVLLGDGDFVGQAAIDAVWKEGFKQALLLPGELLVK